MINCRVRKIVVQNLNYNEAGTASSLFSFTAIRSIFEVNFSSHIFLLLRFFNQLRLAGMHRIKKKRELSLLVSSSSLSFLASPANLIT